MIEQPLRFDLPLPWRGNTFETPRFGEINFLVGPNGSGKSRFATTLKAQLPRSRLLGTDRLRGMEKSGGMGFMGEPFAGGIQKSWFGNLKNAGLNFGFGVDAVVLLEERLDLRIKVEATLSHLFDRTIKLEWDSGNLVPKATLGATGTSYRLDSDECHGIKELLVLLTHLYNDENQYLIIDEPELNLHPQFQAFFMQEVRRVAGDPRVGRPGTKAIFLVTHSPFILDFASLEDIKSVISFDLSHSTPIHLFDLEPELSRSLEGLVPRLNVHHKQLFFSDNPIFVEGIFDAQIVQAIQEARGVSIAGAGSCIIDAGGADEVNKYLQVCNRLRKTAYFLYDLDTLFTGSLRSCIRSENEVADLLASLGLGVDFAQYCGGLENALRPCIEGCLAYAGPEPFLGELRDYLRSLSEEDRIRDWPKARFATLVAMRRRTDAFVPLLGQRAIDDVLGRLARILSVLQTVRVLVLPNGALEHHLPGFAGNVFSVSDEAKKPAVLAELDYLAARPTENDMRARYGALWDAILLLPSKAPVEFDRVLMRYLADYIHQLQGLVLRFPGLGLNEFRTRLSETNPGIDQILELTEFRRAEGNQFTARIRLKPLQGGNDRFCTVSESTIAGMQAFVVQEEG